MTDRFVARMSRFRLGFQILALVLGAPMLVWIGLAPSFTAMLVAAAAYGVFRGFFEVNTHASLFDVIAPKYRSTAVGLLNMIAFFFGGLSGVVMGWLAEVGRARVRVRLRPHGGELRPCGRADALSFLFTFRRNRVVEG